MNALNHISPTNPNHYLLSSTRPCPTPPFSTGLPSHPTVASIAGMFGRNPNAPDPSDRLSCDLVVANRMGIHARPAAMFVRIASRFHSEIEVEKDGERINGKSIMGLMMLAAGPGSRLHLVAIGSDASEAIQALQDLVHTRKFDEE